MGGKARRAVGQKRRIAPIPSFTELVEELDGVLRHHRGGQLHDVVGDLVEARSRRPGAGDFPHELRRPLREVLAEQLEGAHVTGHDDEPGGGLIGQRRNLISHRFGVVLPEVLGPLLVAPLGPAAGVRLAQARVVATVLPHRGDRGPARADAVGPAAEHDNVGAGPVGQHDEVRHRRLRPLDQGAHAGQRGDPTGGAGRGLRFVANQPGTGAVGHHGQRAAHEVGAGHQRIDRRQRLGRCAVVFQPAAQVLPAQLVLLGGLLDGGLGAEVHGHEGPGAVEGGGDVRNGGR
jgi:hypothetical protein